jgi:hypothetical protein
MHINGRTILLSAFNRLCSTFLGEPCDQLVIQGPSISLAAGETVVAVDVIIQSLVRGPSFS